MVKSVGDWPQCPKEDSMKYVIEYEIRTAGLTHDQNFANQDALLKAFGKWTPEEGLTVWAFVSNMNNGGYVLVEAADPGVVYSFVSKFVYWNEVKVVPVFEVADGVAIGTESLAWARAAVSD
jgi:hypothetical protein